MKSKSNQYWKDRFANDIWTKYNNQERKHIDIANMYIDIFHELEKEIASTLIKINGGRPMLSDMHKYNRLTKLQSNLIKLVNKHVSSVENRFTEVSSKLIEDNYKDVMISLGVLDFGLPSQELIESIVKYPWSGSYFSERLWKNTQLLSFNLNEILTKGLVQGVPIAQMTSDMQLRMDAEYKVCLRLIRTETMAYLNQSSLEAYKNAGVEKVQWWTALDERVSSECKKLHGTIHPTNNLPMMPKRANCRCTWIPIIEVK